MLNNVIKVSFASVGAITGFTLTKTFFLLQTVNLSLRYKTIVFLLASLAVALIFYATGGKIIEITLEATERLEAKLRQMTLYELALGSGGLIAGLIIANLITIPINKVEFIGMPIAIIANVLFGCIGAVIAGYKKNEGLLEGFKGKDGSVLKPAQLKLLDTSVVIDGRIVEIVKSGFLEGEMIVPDFILEELRHIADSQDALKRNRGRRGLDVLNIMQKELQLPVRVEKFDMENDSSDVDDKLLKAAKKIGARVLTIDFNLNKVASFHGVEVMNINELANSVKPIALPGEEMIVQVVKDGKEQGQGVGYMEDGTMIVVEGGRRHMGEEINITVTSVLQTAAGRMIFAKPKNPFERVF